ncbi:biotin transporter BioY [Methanobrevibacter filiformis]|uniref:Biotin transporter BioY n=1 Tax=Methanobrevibacter filiformis TaxID=55758 RepID=A0A166CWF1_9EURY|nr:biotin transporter BioY [Methanobrevibacter filiformis]KZX14934.1 biotin transporter BioY [Methanobrevibacter filiformis]
MNINLDTYYTKRKNVFDRIHNSNNIEKTAMVVLMACLTGIMAQIIIPLPWSPVPITGQTFAVLVSGLILGKKLGPLSQILYFVLGIIGINWFGGATGGLEIAFGSNFGYFIGFIFASMFIGYLTEKYAKSRKLRNIIPLMVIANFICIYVPGLIILAIWFNVTQGAYPDIISLLVMGLIPFIIGDIVKIIGASAISKALLPKTVN